jgi:hypothetical protein
MADHGHQHGHGHTEQPSHGSMDMTEKVQTWLAFWNATKYSVLVLVGMAILLAIFRTHNGMY